MGADLNDVLAAAIALAKANQCLEVTPDHILEAALLSISRFGIVRLGELMIDLEALEINWLGGTRPSQSQPTKLSYSDAAVALLDRAAWIAKGDRAATTALAHLLAAFRFDGSSPLLTRIANSGVTSKSWRSALIDIDDDGPAPSPAPSDSVSPEQAAAILGVHHQTIRGYIRSGKLPAFRLAGERAVRIRRSDLDQLFEPVSSPNTNSH